MNINGGFIWIAISQATQLVANFVLLKILTTQLSVSSFGKYSLYLTIVLFFRQVLYDPISITAARNCATAMGNQRQFSWGEFWAIGRIGDLLLLFFLLGGLLFFAINRGAFGDDVADVAIIGCLIYLASTGPFGAYLNILNSLRYRTASAAFLVVDSLLKVIAVYFISLRMTARFDYVLLTVGLTSFVVTLVLRFYIIRNFYSKSVGINISCERARATVVASYPFVIPSTLTAIKNVGERWVLTLLVGFSELATFSVLLQVGYMPMLLAIGAVQTFLAPNIYELCQNSNYYYKKKLMKYLNKIIAFILSVTFISALIVTGASDLLLKTTSGDNYSSFSKYLAIFVLSGGISAACAILSIAVIGSFSSKVAGRLMSFTVVSAISCSILSTFFWGFDGAVFGLFSGSILSFVTYWVALNRYTQRAS